MKTLISLINGQHVKKNDPEEKNGVKKDMRLGTYCSRKMCRTLCLSHLGRDYIETGKYIERIFPSMGSRSIAINGCIDSGQKSQVDEIVIPY